MFSEAGSSPPRVFISYSHDSAKHADRVLALADRLREDGVDCMVDQYEPAPQEGWPRWMTKQIKRADFVLLVCTETYYRRVMGEEQPGKGRGADREGLLIDQALYDARGRNDKFIAVLFDSRDRAYIPDWLRLYTSYRVDTKKGYEQLYRRLTAQPDTLVAQPPPAGLVKREASFVKRCVCPSRRRLGER